MDTKKPKRSPKSRKSASARKARNTKITPIITRSAILSILSSLLFLAGILLEISISLGVAWGEVEARVYAPQYGDADLPMKCPLMLSPGESGTISATVNNTIDDNATPTVTADFSRVSGDQQFSQTISLAPHESQTLQWTVDTSDMIYGRLILINISQSRYGNSPTNELPARQGACGILILSLFGLNGSDTFRLLFAASLIGIIAGVGLWLRANPILDDTGRSIAHASTVLASVATFSLLSSFPRWWGLILLLDVIALILIVVILTELVLFPRQERN